MNRQERDLLLGRAPVLASTEAASGAITGYGNGSEHRAQPVLGNAAAGRLAAPAGNGARHEIAAGSAQFPLHDPSQREFQEDLLRHLRASDIKRFDFVCAVALEAAQRHGIGDGFTVGDVAAAARAYLATSQALDKQAATGWQAPQEFSAKTVPAPYPINALPSLMRDAVAEVEGFVQAPSAMVATSALAALSIAGQALADVRRADGLQGPISLNIAILADSGERKTTCDEKFASPIRDYERNEAERLAPKVAEYQAARAAWEAGRLGILDAIRRAKREAEETSDLQKQLIDHDIKKAKSVRVPRIMRTDSTPEALALSLAREWPVGAIQSSEGGLILGGHAMNPDTAMRNFGLLNVLWDGGEMHISRKTSESFTLRGARLTFAIQVQAGVLRDFLARDRGLSRSSGWLARILFANPITTQGTRAFREPPAGWPRLTAYTCRLAKLLAIQPNIMPAGSLEPVLLDLDSDAKAAWVHWHNEIEAQLGVGGDLERLRDVASKAADNCARVAALFHLLEHDAQGPIQVESIVAAGQVVAWHLTEAMRFFGDLALPSELSAAARLEGWLIDAFNHRGIGSMTRREVQQYGPIRDALALDAALSVLAELDRAKLVTDGKKKNIAINPALLRGAK